MKQHRKSPRHYAQKLARIVFEDGRSPQRCIVLDTSEGGARLLVEPENLPEKFLLFCRLELSLREATVVRRQFKTIGVRLSPPLSLASEKLQDIRCLKDLSPIFCRD